MLLKHFLAGENAGRSDVLADMSKYLVGQGKHVVYYGNNIGPEDSDAVLMHWKLSDGKYMVILGDLRGKEVSSEELIEMQARMLQKKAK